MNYDAKENLENAIKSANLNEPESMIELFNAVASYFYTTYTRKTYEELEQSGWYADSCWSDWARGCSGDEWQSVRDCIESAFDAAIEYMGEENTPTLPELEEVSAETNQELNDWMKQYAESEKFDWEPRKWGRIASDRNGDEWYQVIGESEHNILDCATAGMNLYMDEDEARSRWGKGFELRFDPYTADESDWKKKMDAELQKILADVK